MQSDAFLCIFVRFSAFLCVSVRFFLIFLSLFFGIPCFFLLQGIPCFFECFPLFPKDFRGSPGKKNPCFFGSFLAFYRKKARKGRSGSPTNNFKHVEGLSGTGDSQRDSRESIRANHSQLTPHSFIVRQADSHESLEFPDSRESCESTRANHATKLRGKHLSVLSHHLKREMKSAHLADFS